MLYVALAELGLLALTLYGSWGIIRSLTRAHARHEDQLLDKALHAAGTPWAVPPVDEFIPPPKPIYDDEGELLLSQQYARFTLTPEQEP